MQGLRCRAPAGVCAGRRGAWRRAQRRRGAGRGRAGRCCSAVGQAAARRQPRASQRSGPASRRTQRQLYRAITSSCLSARRARGQCSAAHSQVRGTPCDAEAQDVVEQVDVALQSDRQQRGWFQFSSFFFSASFFF